ncbi:penicillin-binding protein 2, partial [Klebsiella pneumoniae]|nr:penicillin-binding protein 2 [Klebsiella pneumoniae]
PVGPGRGMIYDRNGRLLAENVPAFRLDVTPDKVKDMDATLEGLAKIISISPEELEAFNKSRKARRKFLPVTLKLRMS